MTINKGIGALHTNGFNKEQAESEHKKSYGKMPELDYQLIMFGMSAQKLNENEDDEPYRVTEENQELWQENADLSPGIS